MRFLVLSLALLCGSAQAVDLPPCWPRQVGSTGSDYRIGETPDGTWLGWTCAVAGQQKPYGVWAVHDYKLIHPAVIGFTPIHTARTYFQFNVTNPADIRMVRLRAAMTEGMK